MFVKKKTKKTKKKPPYSVLEQKLKQGDHIKNIKQDTNIHNHVIKARPRKHHNENNTHKN